MGAGAPAHVIRFIESTDAADPSGGTVLGDLARPPLASGQSDAFVGHALTLPVALPPAPTTRYIHMVIDPAETVAAFDRAGLFLWVCANGAAP